MLLYMLVCEYSRYDVDRNIFYKAVKYKPLNLEFQTFDLIQTTACRYAKYIGFVYFNIRYF